jgi:RNA:NAD 2'-phosphotransferase (TPT1/KptA family)
MVRKSPSHAVSVIVLSAPWGMCIDLDLQTWAQLATLIAALAQLAQLVLAARRAPPR